MKTKVILLFTTVFFLFAFCLNAQVVDPKKEAEKEGTKRVNNNIDKSIDKSFDKLEEGIGSLFGKKNKKNKNEQENQPSQTNEQSESANAQAGEEGAAPTLNWAKYDFVPGDKVIFEDNQENEENGEFPSRWDLVKGTIENAEFGGENIIMFRGGNPMIIPYLQNPGKDYLPDVFTVEFDLYTNNHNPFEVYFYDNKNQRVNSSYKNLSISYDGLRLSPASSNIPNRGTIENQWAHIAIAYTNGKLKAYINETRLINIPHLAFDPIGITLYAYHGSDKNVFYIKNFRLAEGGVKYYDRFLQDGKIIANGIRFDVNKATLRPESMGVINEIAELMKDHPEINFSVEGHTDSDGDDALNQTLSENRAQTVMQTLAKMGIDSNRMTSRGWGESKPMDTNDTPEGKANNRRVEFVKM
jgi:outer membrane protein OmpA-like peptidoglycan-associated protein